MGENEFRVLIKRCFLMGRNFVQEKQWLDKFSAPSQTSVKRWYADLKRGLPDTSHTERSGCPNSAVVPEIIKKVYEIVLADRKFKMCEIAENLKVSEGNVFAVLHNHFSMRKLLSKRVPRLLTVDQKQQHIDDSERCLELFKQNK
ncbi:hypothetical protein TNCV_4203751 [Trichonephila clavipes]|nr:hypothetical protein TNCV_4203751 [Trichonephila clavipes]